MIKRFRILYPWEYQKMPLPFARKERVCQYLNNQPRYAIMRDYRKGSIKPHPAIQKATRLVLKKLFTLSSQRRPAILIVMTENSGVLQALATVVPMSFAFTRAQMYEGDMFRVPTCETVSTYDILQSAFGNSGTKYNTPEGVYELPLYQRAADVDMLFWEDAHVVSAGVAKFESTFVNITKNIIGRGYLVLAVQIKKYSASITRQEVFGELSRALGSGASKVLGVASTLYIKAHEQRGEDWTEVL